MSPRGRSKNDEPPFKERWFYVMEVLIIGAGALGKCMAGLLAQQASVTLYERDLQTRRALMHGGFTFQREKSAHHSIRVHVIGSLDKIERPNIDVLVFATKIMDLRAAVTEAVGLNPRCVLLPQNGIFDYRWTRRFFKKAHICRGVTTMACQETGHRRVKLFYQGDIYVGGDGALFIADLFRKSGVQAKAYRNSDGAVWAKLIFSAVMNPLPVITGQGYQVLNTDKDIWRLVKQAVAEGRTVARAAGVALAFDPMKLIERVRNGDLAGIEHRGSIVHDRNAGRSTELDFITGALVRLAGRQGVKASALKSIWARAKSVGA